MKELLSPNQVAKALGVSEASLKRWCDKGLLPATRTVGGHRRLPLSGVMAFIREHGQSLVQPEVLGLPPATGKGNTTTHQARILLRTALEAGDYEQASRLVFNLFISGHSAQQICDNVMAPAFHDIGDRWSHGNTEIYEERRGVEIGMRVLHDLRAAVPPASADAPRAIGATLEGDPYALPCMMCEIVLRETGWQALSYGVGHPSPTLQSAILRVRPSLLWISVSAFKDADQFLDQYQPLFEVAARNNAAVVVGGRALTPEVREKMQYCAFCDNLGHLAAFAATLLTKRSSADEPQ